MGRVVIFAPSPTLTVTIEGTSDAPPDIHVHPGGQGIWQARMLKRLGSEVTICAMLTGETGRVIGHLLADDGIRCSAVFRHGNGSAYVHDRRNGERAPVAETTGDPITRHDLDELYGVTLREALESDAVILSGPAGEGVVPDDVYRRLAADLAAAEQPVIVDLAGSRLMSALDGGVLLAKISDEELHADGLLAQDTMEAIVEAARKLRQRGAQNVVVTQSKGEAVFVGQDDIHTIRVPEMEAVDSRGAGDSFTAAAAATLADGGSLIDAMALGAAAGALNVTRHGLGSGDSEAIHRLRSKVVVTAYKPDERRILSPHDLALRVETDD